MANKIAIEIVVNDNGSVTLKRFGDNAERSLRGVDAAAGSAASGFSKLNGVVAALAASFALWKISDYIKDVATLAARYEMLGVAMHASGKNAFYTKGEMDAAAAGMQKLGISMIESRQQAIRLVTANIALSQATTLARVAQDVARVSGINSSEAFARMIQGIRSGETETLKTIGLQIDLNQAYRDFEKANGLAKGSILETSKAQAVANAVAKEATAKYKDLYAATADLAGGQIASFPRLLEDFKIKMGEAFSPATADVMKSVTNAMKGLQDEITKPEAKAALAALGREISTLIVLIGEKLPGALNGAITALNGLLNLYNSLPDGVVGAAGAGLVGRMIFGAGPAGLVVGAIYFINDALGKTELAMRKINEEAKMGTAFKEWLAKNAPGGPFQGGSPGAVSGAGRTWEDPAIAGERKREEQARQAAAEAAAALAAEVAARKKKQATEQITEAIRKNAFELDAIGKGQHEKELIRIAEAADKYKKDGVDKIAVAKYVASETAIAVAAERERNNLALQRAEGELFDLREKENAEYLRKMKEEAEKAAKAEMASWIEAGDEAVAQMERTIDQGVKTTMATIEQGEKRLAAERDIYQDLRGYEGAYHEASLALIASQAAEYRRLKVSETAVAAWVAEETQKSYIKMGKSSDDWTRGVAAGLVELQRKTISWGQAAYDAVVAFAGASKTALSDIFFDAAKQKFDSFGDYLSKFWDSMLRKFTDILGQMASEWAMKMAGFAFLGGGGGLSGIAGAAASGAGGFLGSAASGAGLSGLFGVGGGGSLASWLATPTAGGIAASAGMTGTGSIATVGSTIGSFLLPAGLGYLGGGLLSRLTGGNQTGGSLGGAAGAVLGQMFIPIPGLGALIGGVGGSLLGGLFGGGNKWFGSMSSGANPAAGWGALPSLGAWAQQPGASSAASAADISTFEQSVFYTIEATKAAVAAEIAKMDAATAARATEALNQAIISYLPGMAEVTTGNVNPATHGGFDVTGFAYRDSSLPYLPDYLAAIPQHMLAQINPILEQAKREAEETAAAVKVQTDLARQQRNLDIRLMELQGDAVGALAARRADELAALDESLRPTMELIYAEQDLKTAAEEAARAVARQAEIDRQRRTLDIRLMELQGDAAGALAARRTDELAAMDESLRATQELIYAAEDLAAAAAEAARMAEEARAAAARMAQEGLTSAEDGLRAAFAAEKERLAEAYNNERAALEASLEAMQAAYRAELDAANVSLRAVRAVVSGLERSVDKLKSARERMRLEDARFDRDQYRVAQGTLARILAQARTGDLSGVKGIDKTLETLTGSSADLYDNFVDYQRDYWKTYNAISELETLTGKQLVTEKETASAIERQIDLLEINNEIETAAMRAQIDLLGVNHQAQMAAMDRQLNALLGIDAGVLSIAQAIENLTRAQAAAVGAGVSGARNTAVNAVVDQIYQTVLDRNPAATGDAAGAAWWADRIISGADTASSMMIESINSPEFLGKNASDLIGGVYRALLDRDPLATGDAAGKAYWEGRLAEGTPITRIAEEMMNSSEYAGIRAVRGFATGGFHPGGWRVVGESGPEVEYTPPSRIYSNSESKALVDISELVAEVKSLRNDQQAANYEIAKNTRKTAKILDRMDGSRELADITLLGV